MSQEKPQRSVAPRVSPGSPPKPPPDSGWLDGPREVRVRREGRISYSITIYDGPMMRGPWNAIGSRKHADAKARRVFRRYLRRQAMRSDVITLTPEDLR